MIGRKKIHKGDMLLVVIILAAALSLIVWRYHTAGQGKMAAIVLWRNGDSFRSAVERWHL